MAIILWIVLSALVGLVGSERQIGFWGSFLLSLLLSPIIGFIFTIVSKTNSAVARDKQLSSLHQEQIRALKNINSQPSNSNSVDELAKIATLKEKGLITEEEYQRIKNKILG